MPRILQKIAFDIDDNIDYQIGKYVEKVHPKNTSNHEFVFVLLTLKKNIMDEDECRTNSRTDAALN